MLIPDITDQLFDNIFNRNQTFRSAKFIQNDRNVSFTVLKLFQQDTDLHRRCDKQHRADDIFQRSVGMINKIVEILLVDNAYDVVDIFFVDRKS